jgi:hypothetical protein
MPSQTLQEAVQEVIRQNKSLGYHPEIFIYQMGGGNLNDDDLRVPVYNLVLNENAYKAVMDAIIRYGDILTIEDLIVESEDGFGLPQEAINQAQQNEEAYDWQRKNRHYMQ